ncbi:hypothetical protein FHY05_001281 [Sphingomonas sp. BK580]|nr:hypothetical protein [Sphingomonas sp. BK580]
MEPPKQRSAAPAEKVTWRLLRPRTRCDSSGLGNAGGCPLTPKFQPRERNLLLLPCCHSFSRSEPATIIPRSQSRRENVYTPRMAVILATLLVAVPVSGQPPIRSFERYRVTLQGGGLGVDVDETVLISVILDDGEGERWIAERLRRDYNWCADRTNSRCSPGERVIHDWIDGDACPELKTSLRKLSQIAVVGFAPPERSSPGTVTETPLLTVSGTPDRMAGLGAHLTLAGFTGPVVDWWSRSERSLATCWSTKSLAIGGQELEAQLSFK